MAILGCVYDGPVDPNHWHDIATNYLCFGLSRQDPDLNAPEPDGDADDGGYG